MRKNKFLKLNILATILAFSLCVNVYAVDVDDKDISPYDNSAENEPGYDETVRPYDFIYRRYEDDYKSRVYGNVIEYDLIEDMVHTFNPNVLSWWNKYENNKTSDDVYNDYMDSYNSIMDSADSMELEAMAARLRAQAYAIKMLADNNINDSVINFYNYKIDETKLYLDAKTKFINYYIAKYDEDILKEKLAKCERNLAATKIKYDVGLATNIDYLNALKDRDDTLSSLSLATTNVSVALKNIKIVCGKSIDDSTSVGNVPYIDINYINNIVLPDDIEKAIKNNINLKIYNKAYKNANTDEVKKNYKILLDYANESIENSIKSKYDNLKNALNDYETKKLSVRLLTEEYNKSKDDFNNGKISANDLKDKLNDKNIAELESEKSLLNIKVALDSYNYDVDGLANATT